MKTKQITVLGSAIALMTCLASQAFASADKPVIMMSNSFLRDAWRREMVDIFNNTASKAKQDGLISDFNVVTADGTPNQQNAQLAQMILQKPDAILVDAASTTASNGIIKRACSAGILVISFDSVVTEPCVYILSTDWSGYATGAQYVAKQLNGKGNVLVIRGQAGAGPDKEMYDQQMSGLKAYPDVKVVAEVSGQWSPSITQSAVSSILPNLPHIDAVLTQGGSDDYGAVRAIEAFGGEYKAKPPTITGNGDYEFLEWAIKQHKENGYQTLSVQNNPGISSAAFWLAYELLKGAKAERKQLLPMTILDADQAEKVFAEMKPGGQIAIPYDRDYVRNNLLVK